MLLLSKQGWAGSTQRALKSNLLKRVEKMNEKTQKLTVSAVMIALATALSFVKLWEMPLGGAVTLLSMLPMCLLSVMYGVKWSALPCFVYAAIQMAVSGVFGWGLTPTVLVGAIIFDYLAPFTCLCFAGAFRKKGLWGIVFGILLVCVVRFLFHFASGCIFFRSYELFNNPYMWSLAYNGTFMLPELGLTLVGAVALFKVPAINKFIKL